MLGNEYMVCDVVPVPWLFRASVSSCIFYLVFCGKIAGMSELWALIDANNFFVSCERVFRPDLQAKPVIVLSCNDGCVVSRSVEAKELGIPMGVPRFQIERDIKEHGIEVFSSNFRLYGDISGRMMRVIARAVGRERQEIYSIDECFVRLPVDGRDWQEWAVGLREQIGHGVGVPVTVGVAKSKTLAKLAVEIAKKDFLGREVMDWSAPSAEKPYLENISVTQVWGLGQASSQKLQAAGVRTVAALVAWPEERVQQVLHLPGVRTWWELQGISCIEQTNALVSHRQILRSRSFGEAVRTKAELAHALGTYLREATECLRKNSWRAAFVSVFIQTSRFVAAEQKYMGWASVSLDESSSFLPDLAAAMRKALEKCFRPGYDYKRAGVILSGLENEGERQPRLLGGQAGPKIDEDKKQAVMKAVDQLNHAYRSYKVNVGMVSESKQAAGGVVQRKWQSRATRRSPEYTTKFGQLRRVK